MNLNKFQQKFQDKLAHYAVGSIVEGISILLAFIVMFFYKNTGVFFIICTVGIIVSIWLANWKEKQDSFYSKSDRNWTFLGSLVTFLIAFFTYLMGYNFGIGAF